jgi:hypothetical protein
LQRQRILFSAYRTDQYSDPDGYLTSLGMVLEQYPDEVILFITDPRTGVHRGQHHDLVHRNYGNPNCQRRAEAGLAAIWLSRVLAAAPQVGFSRPNEAGQGIPDPGPVQQD